jgi:uncharacterized protein YfiM (DUF2279 family)
LIAGSVASNSLSGTTETLTLQLTNNGDGSAQNVFAVAGMLAYRSARSAAGRIVTCASIAAVAFLLEMLQSRRFAHEMEWPDVLVDVACLLFAMVFYCP